MRKKLEPDFNLDVNQIVVPKCLHKELLRLAHDVSMAANLGINKTTNRLNRFLWWPSMSKDIHYYCISRNTCQLLSKSPQPKKASLVNLPIRNTAFEYISGDIVGPLPQCHDTGNRFIFRQFTCARDTQQLLLYQDIRLKIQQMPCKAYFVNLEYIDIFKVTMVVTYLAIFGERLCKFQS